VNDRQRLEAIIEVLGRYLPPDGPLTEHEAMNEIIGLVDPLPPAAPQFVAGEATRPMCHGAWARYWSEPNNDDSCGQAMRWLEAWRAELGPALGLETQRHRDNEIDALEQKLTRADARIAELELELAQWRLELRIYRETENKRIAELEQSVTVLDTEVARLETDLELARREVSRLREALDQSALEYADLSVSAKSLEDHLHALVEVSEDSTIARARAVMNGDDIGEDEDAARAGNGGGV